MGYWTGGVINRTMDKEAQKKAIYERLSPRRKKFIDKIGYDKWDPFQEPNHPIEIRRDVTKRTAKQLVREFLEYKDIQDVNSAYGRGVFEFCLGMFSSNERYKAMFDFCLWYSERLKQQGLKPDDVWDR